MLKSNSKHMAFKSKYALKQALISFFTSLFKSPKKQLKQFCTLASCENLPKRSFLYSTLMKRGLMLEEKTQHAC